MRKGPYQTNILLGGYDKGAGPSLYFMDVYSALSKVNFGVHGHASNFLLSIFDREWKVSEHRFSRWLLRIGPSCSPPGRIIGARFVSPVWLIIPSCAALLCFPTQKEGMSVEEAKVVVDKCVQELHTRFLISQPNFKVKIVDKNGVRIL